MVVMYVTKHIAIVLTLSMYCKFRWKHFFVRKNLFEVYLTQCKKNNQHENRYGPVSLGRQWGIFVYFIIRFNHIAQIGKKMWFQRNSTNVDLDTHCCIKCPQNLQVKTLLQKYTAFTCRIYNKILLKVFDPRNRGNLLLKLQFFVL